VLGQADQARGLQLAHDPGHMAGGQAGGGGYAVTGRGERAAIEEVRQFDEREVDGLAGRQLDPNPAATEGL
jgi:hypothetical protein